MNTTPTGANLSEGAARQILLDGARALARGDGLGSTLQVIIGSIAEQLGVGSAVIVVVGEDHDLEIVASIGLGDAAAARVAGAIAHPAPPIARTVREPVSSFDVAPTVPGGPALRSHVPLIVTRGGTDAVLGVLALAYDRAFDLETRPLIQAGADLAAVAIERDRPG
jgi:GAF domain-containing protein